MQIIKYILIAIISISYLNCSNSKIISQNKNNNKKIETSKKLTKKEKESKTLENFINGATADAKKDYEKAIRFYFLALETSDEKAGIYYAISKDYYLLNKISPALHTIKKSIKIEPQNLQYNSLLADIYTAGNQYDSASVVLDSIIATDSTKLNYYYRLARLYEHSKPLKAIKIYNKISDKIGVDWNVLIRVAELNEKLNKIPEAIKTLNQLLTIDPNNAQIRKLLVQLFIKEKNKDKALKTINNILEVAPDDLEARRMKAQIYLVNNDWHKAAKEYLYILKSPKVSLVSKITTAGTYFNKALKDSSLLSVTKELFTIIDKDTLDWQVKLYLGALDVSMGNNKGAMQNFKQVTELAKWIPDGWIRLGGLYFDNRKYKEATTLMKQALNQFPNNFTINLIMGLSLSQEGKNEESLKYLDKSVELNPNDLNALSGYAFALQQSGRDEESVTYLKQALDISPKNVNLLGTLGLIYNNQNKLALSDSVYESALKIDSTNIIVNNNYAYSLSERDIKLDRALKMVKISIAADSLNASYLDTIGWVYFKLKKYKLAKKYLKKAIKEGGETPTMLEHLGDIEFYLRNATQAKKLWRKALKMDTKNKKLEMKIKKGII